MGKDFQIQIFLEFTTMVISELKDILNIKTEEDEKLMFNGYKIYLTMDINMQKV